MGSSAIRKSSNEHEFFVPVTSLNKIGEGRIRDLTGDVLFPVTFKCAMLIVIRKRSRESLFIIGDDRASRKQSLIMIKAISYLKKSSLEGGHYPSRHDRKSP